MSKWISAALASLLLAGCGQRTESPHVNLSVEDLEDFIDWKEDQEEVELDPFKAKPISVTGTGTVRAAPDIAVVTGLIKAEADFDWVAMDDAAKIINRVQEIISGKNVEVSFTTLSTIEKRDEACVAQNIIAQQRHRDINADNWFNKNQLRQRADVRQKLRPAKPRIAEKVCEVTHVESFLGFTAWIRPSNEVSDYLTAFTEAGVEKVDLFGFDFSNYDTLYKEASEKAVANAREKAELSARIAGTKLTTVESFRVTGTERRRRYGQQAQIISPHGNLNTTPNQRTSFSDRVIKEQAAAKRRANQKSQNTRNNRVSTSASRAVQPSPPSHSIACWDGSMVFGAGQCPALPAPVVEAIPTESLTSGFSGGVMNDVVVVQEASTEFMTVNGTLVERTIPAITSTSQWASQSNALRETMLSGSKVIRVQAALSYNYETPLDGVIFKTVEEK